MPHGPTHQRDMQIVELRARVGKLEAELKLVRPKSDETYTQWVNRIFLRTDYRDAVNG